MKGVQILILFALVATAWGEKWEEVEGDKERHVRSPRHSSSSEEKKPKFGFGSFGGGGGGQKWHEAAARSFSGGGGGGNGAEQFHKMFKGRGFGAAPPKEGSTPPPKKMDLKSVFGDKTTVPKPSGKGIGPVPVGPRTGNHHGGTFGRSFGTHAVPVPQKGPSGRSFSHGGGLFKKAKPQKPQKSKKHKSSSEESDSHSDSDSDSNSSED